MTTFVITRVRTDGRVNSTTVDGYDAEPVMLHLRGKYTADKKTLALHIFQDGQHYSSWKAPAKEDPPWKARPHPIGTFDATVKGVTTTGKVHCTTEHGKVFVDPFAFEIGDAVKIKVTHRKAGGVLFVDAVLAGGDLVA